MRGCWIAVIVYTLGTVLSLTTATVVLAQEGIGENLVVAADRATTWVDPNNTSVNVVQLEGSVRIELDRNTMSADYAVIWLSPGRGQVLEHQEAEIALLGSAVLDQPGQFQRSGDRLRVTANVRGAIRVTARSERQVGNASGSEVYKAALLLRPPPATAEGPELDNWWLQPPVIKPPQPMTQPAKRLQPIGFSADKVETVQTADGTVAILVTGNVKLYQRRGDVETIELQADRAVLFTPLRSMRELEGGGQKFTKVEEAITSAYLEGDVRIVHTPPNRKLADQRLRANRAFYDFATDRAILTDAVIHTIEPQKNIPVVVRAQTVRQLSMGEYRGEKVKLTQSSFNTPSYHIGMREAYIRQVDSGDPVRGVLTTFTGTDTTFNAQGVPFFWLPAVGGSFTERGGALRNISISSDNRFGFGTETRWGIFETLGKLPPRDIDAELALDYFCDRGPAVGLNGRYGGGFITESTRQPWSFNGTLESYMVNDHGEDDLGRKRIDVEPEKNLRYRLLWEHQHFFPDDWQVQVTSALISDPTFQEQWFRNDFYHQRPLDTAIYVKRQKQTEAFTLLYSFQPNDFVTSSNNYQEGAEVERVPEIGYHRIGDRLGQDGPTFFSDNTLAGLRFQKSRASFSELGFAASDSPGLPSFGTTGTPSTTTWRGDFRQEVNLPFTWNQFRVVPYIMGRYTAYTESPEDSANDRLLVGGGVRLTTAFWKVDDTVRSELWDLNRLRHIIEPQVNLFASASTTDRNRLYHYEESVDEINDISAVQLALRQRWQTKRGGPGRWRSVDFLSLNVEATFFSNKPKNDELAPVAFRGLYFMSEPETSIPRDSINADATWRVSDTTAVLADASYNMEESSLATASLGVAFTRDTRLQAFVGVRYIDSGSFLVRVADDSIREKGLHSVVVTGAINYELTPKYTLGLRQSFDFGARERVLGYYSLIRQFDRWYASITFRFDYIDDDNGVFINLWPDGLGTSATQAERLQQVFR